MNTNNSTGDFSQLKFGEWKDSLDLELADLKKYPVWVDCMLLSMIGVVDDEEDGPMGGTETSVRPLIGTTNVLSEFRHATILLRVADSEFLAVGTYNVASGVVNSVLVYNPDGSFADRNSLALPLKLESIPEIAGERGVSFIVDGTNINSAR